MLLVQVRYQAITFPIHRTKPRQLPHEKVDASFMTDIHFLRSVVGERKTGGLIKGSGADPRVPFDTRGDLFLRTSHALIDCVRRCNNSPEVDIVAYYEQRGTFSFSNLFQSVIQFAFTKYKKEVIDISYLEPKTVVFQRGPFRFEIPLPTRIEAKAECSRWVLLLKCRNPKSSVDVLYFGQWKALENFSTLVIEGYNVGAIIVPISPLGKYLMPGSFVSIYKDA
ncbi:hypothetical protein Tco_0453727 [Tanacetum coccineum]